MKSFERIAAKVTPEIKRKVRKNIDIANQIKHILNEKGMYNKDLAELLGKHESEISKWLTGLHNFTQETICKIETVLDADVLMTDLRAQEKYCSTVESHQSSTYRKSVDMHAYVSELWSFTQSAIEVKKTILRQ